MLTEYVQAAMRHARCEWLPEEGSWYCEIPVATGVWATGDTEEAARAELRAVLEGWIAIGLALHHPMPVIDGVELVVSANP